MTSEGARRAQTDAWARTLVDALVQSGVKFVVICPGSRSTPLVFAAARHPGLRTLLQVDERSAAFMALGMGKATGEPAAVLTTSGTAVANLVPAAVEAGRAEAPLLLLTADRPPRLRQSDANQVVDQLAILGGVVRHQVELSPAGSGSVERTWLGAAVARAVAAARGDPGGAAHLNVPFEKPLEPLDPQASGGVGDGAPGVPRVAPRRLMPPRVVLEELAEALDRARRPLLVAGRLPRPLAMGPAVARLAGEATPLLADALSGARGAGGIDAHDLVLGSASAREHLTPDLVLQFGAAPTSPRVLTALGEWSARGARIVVVDGGESWKDHQLVSTDMVPGDVEAVARYLETARDLETARYSAPGPVDPEWPGRWQALEQAALQAALPLLEDDPGEPSVAMELLRQMGAGQVLFVSSSMPIRDVDRLGVDPGRGRKGREPGQGGGLPLVLGNRGASGIDGVVSTAMGAGLARGEPVTALVGDLALLHDMNGLLALGEMDVPLRLVVVNNDGGGIFRMLPVSEFEPEFTRFFTTPHGREPEAVAALHQMAFRRVDLRGTSSGADRMEALREALAPAASSRGGTGDLKPGVGGGHVMVEVRVDPDHDMELRRLAADAAVEAVERLLGEWLPDEPNSNSNSNDGKRHA